MVLYLRGLLLARKNNFLCTAFILTSTTLGLDLPNFLAQLGKLSPTHLLMLQFKETTSLVNKGSYIWKGVVGGYELPMGATTEASSKGGGHIPRNLLAFQLWHTGTWSDDISHSWSFVWYICSFLCLSVYFCLLDLINVGVVNSLGVCALLCVFTVDVSGSLVYCSMHTTEDRKCYLLQYDSGIHLWIYVGTLRSLQGKVNPQVGLQQPNNFL